MQTITGTYNENKTLNFGCDGFFEEGSILYVKTNHLGNVLVTVTDRRNPIESQTTSGEIAYYEADIASAQDYYPFGATMPGRVFGSDSYTYGFSGHEKDDEIKGVGNSYDMGARLYDSRIGRTPSIDAHASNYPSISPYAYSVNNPIYFIDIDGNDVMIAFTGGPTGGGQAIQIEDAYTTGQVVKEAQKTAMCLGVKFDAIIIAPGWTAGSSVKTAYEFIKENYTEGERLIIYGYSYGGDFAVELSDKLKKEGIQVDLLITVDASDGPLQNITVNTTIPDNVTINENYYQTSSSGYSSTSRSTNETSSGSSESSSENSSKSNSGTSNFPGSRGGPNKAADPSKTNVINQNMTGPDVTHGNIDRTVQPDVNNSIDQVIGTGTIR